MGTYTTNYQLYMPTVGETGWGTLVNGNFTTIDTTMKGLNTRIGALEPLLVIHVDGNQNVTFPRTISSEGGGTKVDYILINCFVTTDTTEFVYATSNNVNLSVGGSESSPLTFVCNNDYTFNTTPVKIATGIYLDSANATGYNSPTTRTFVIKGRDGKYTNTYFRKKGDTSYTNYFLTSTETATLTLDIGATYEYYTVKYDSPIYAESTLTMQAFPTLYLTTKTP